MFLQEHFYFLEYEADEVDGFQQVIMLSMSLYLKQFIKFCFLYTINQDIFAIITENLQIKLPVKFFLPH